MSEEDRALVATLVTREIANPDPREDLPIGGHNRFHELGHRLLLDHYAKYGVGLVAKGRFMLCSPDLLDGVIDAFSLRNPGEVVLAIGYTSLGTAHAMTTTGRELMIDPLTLTVQVSSGLSPENNFDLQTSFATTVSGLIAGESDPDQPIDLDGNDLHDAVAARLGRLGHGQCYAFTTSMDDEDRFRAENMEKMNVEDYLRRELKREEFDFEYF